MELAGYIRLRCMTNVDCAAEIGVHVITLQNWLSGLRFPRPDELRQIIDATHGAVTANDMLITWRRRHG